MTNKTANLGQLDFPFEIVSAILRQVDLPSLFACRRINCKAMRIINALDEYRDLVHIIPNALRGALSIESGITLARLHNAAFDSKCSGQDLVPVLRCDRSAHFLCVMTGKRYCIRHLGFFTLDIDRNLSLLPQEIDNVYGLKGRDIADLPSFKTLPGQYTPGGDAYKERFHLFDGKSVYERAIEIHGSRTRLRDYQKLRLLEALLSNRLLLPMKWESPEIEWISMPDYMLQNCVHHHTWPLL